MNINVTLFAQIITFVLMIWFVNRVLWGPFTRLLDDRQKRIADGLAAAEKGKDDLERSERRALEVVQEAHAKAAELLVQSEKRAGEIVEEARDTARSEGERLVTAARAEIERESNQAREQLRSEVATLAVAGASRIVKREVDPKAHQALLDDLVSQL